MDGDEDSAPTGPQQAKYSDPRVFMTSFMIPEDQCEMEKRPKDPHTPEIWEKSSRLFYCTKCVVHKNKTKV